MENDSENMVLRAGNTVLAMANVQENHPLGILVFEVEINGCKYEFRTEATRGLHEIDVSSAFRAEYMKSPTPTLPHREGEEAALEGEIETAGEYVPLSGRYTCYIMEMKSGELVEVWNGGTKEIGTVYRGGMTDMRIWEGAELGEHWTWKPKNDEVAGTGEIYLLPGQTSSEVYITGETGDTMITMGDRTVYVENNPRRRSFCFVNSLGLLETISAVTMDAKSYKIDKEEFMLIGKPSMTPNTRHRNKIREQRAIWKMSSGWMTREWLEWWTTEVMCARETWMSIDGRWLPVVLDSGEQVEIYDKAKGELHSVNFEVKAGW